MLPDFPLIIADESVDGRIIKGLANRGYSIYSIIDEHAGIRDIEVIEIAVLRQGYIITEDKDFGDELVYKRIQSIGSMLLRIQDMPIELRVNLVIDTLDNHSQKLKGCFATLTSKKLRIRKYI